MGRREVPRKRNMAILNSGDIVLEKAEVFADIVF
jgi:hypothetical protein